MSNDTLDAQSLADVAQKARERVLHASWECYFYRDPDELDSWSDETLDHGDHTPDECPQIIPLLTDLEAFQKAWGAWEAVPHWNQYRHSGVKACPEVLCPAHKAEQALREAIAKVLDE